MDEEKNDFGDFQNNNYDSDKDKDGNSGDDTIFVENFVWEDIDDDLVISDITANYCGPNVLKEGTENLFQTVLECIMLTSGMSLEYFRWVTAYSNNISWLRSFGGNFKGIKWKKINVQEMVKFYGVMPHMSIENRHLGGHEGYFKPTSYLRVRHGYNVNIFGYGGWVERIMNLERFHQIISDFHPEAGESSVGDKCHKELFQPCVIIFYHILTRF